MSTNSCAKADDERIEKVCCLPGTVILDHLMSIERRIFLLLLTASGHNYGSHRNRAEKKNHELRNYYAMLISMPSQLKLKTPTHSSPSYFRESLQNETIYF